jgi:hypothetical protein
VNDPIQAIWDSVKEGLITWDEARDLQAAIVAELQEALAIARAAAIRDHADALGLRGPGEGE